MSFSCAQKSDKMSNVLTNLLKEKFAKHRSNPWLPWSCLRLFWFNIRRHGCQILFFKLHVDGRKFTYRRPQVVHRWFNGTKVVPSTLYVYHSFRNCGNTI